MRPICLIPARATRSTAPLHNSRSGLIGFLISTGTSTPRNASATSCTLKGFTVVLAPIHNTSTSKFNASCTCLPVATSTVVGMPVCFFACNNQGKPFTPMPSNIPGFVLGFQMPARRISTLPVAARRCAVCNTCSSVSALHGPLMISGRLLHAFRAVSFVDCSIVCIFTNLCSLPLKGCKEVFYLYIFLCARLLCYYLPSVATLHSGFSSLFNNSVAVYPERSEGSHSCTFCNSIQLKLFYFLLTR